MSAVVDVMRIDHPFKVLATATGTPSNPLVDNHIVEHDIEDSIAKNSKANGNQVRIVGCYRSEIEEGYGRQAEDHGEEVVSFQSVVMDSVVGLVPAPQNAVHHILVCPPGDGFPDQEC